MTDAELIRACAEAMGISLPEDDPVSLAFTGGKTRTSRGWEKYDPLHDDAQAMALVKAHSMLIERDGGQGNWRACVFNTVKAGWIDTEDADLNRAICLCVSRLAKGR